MMPNKKFLVASLASIDTIAANIPLKSRSLCKLHFFFLQFSTFEKKWLNNKYQ